MTKQTITLDNDQLRSLAYILSDWAGSIDPEDVVGDDEAAAALSNAVSILAVVENAMPMDENLDEPDHTPYADNDGDDEDDDPYTTPNVQVEIMDADTDAGLALDCQYAMAFIQQAGVPIKSMPRDAGFDGSYLVDVDASWYTQLGDGGSYERVVDYAGHHALVSIAHD